MSNITILIPTSPIPSHPSTAILDETISNIRKYSQAKIILMIDGVAEKLAFRTEDYEQYKATVLEKIDNGDYGNCVAKVFLHHRHQSEMMKQTLPEVDTDLIFFVEHDCYIGGDIPFDAICEMFEYLPDINYIKFNIFHEILEQHKYLMLNDCRVEKFGSNKGQVEFTKTIQYSARPNIARTKWWKDILWTYFPDGYRGMIEDLLYGKVISKYKALGFDTFGMCIYTPPGDQTRSFTSDGRQDDPKIIEA